jgi:hypothetical protein
VAPAGRLAFVARRSADHGRAQRRDFADRTPALADAENGSSFCSGGAARFDFAREQSGTPRLPSRQSRVHPDSESAFAVVSARSSDREQDATL